MIAPHDLLIRALRCPGDLPTLTPLAWDLLVRQARRAGLLARIEASLSALGLLGRLPDGPKGHLEAARMLAAAQHAEALREVHHVVRELGRVGVEVTLLKGAAYLAARRSAASGRMFADIDILVPKATLSAVESALMLSGWATTHHSAYDQRYYRQWMHELPPLRHIQRQTVLDVHHAILPETARLRPNPALLLAAAIPIAGLDGARILAPPDMVLHAMSHLFHNEEMSHGLRDLSDLDLLLREFAVEPGFWGRLVARADELDLGRPLFYGLRYTQRVLATPVPADVVAAAGRAAPARPLLPTMDVLWRRGLRSPHPSARLPGTAAALFALYVRAHWLRMPPALLLRHLAIKAIARPS